MIVPHQYENPEEGTPGELRELLAAGHVREALAHTRAAQKWAALAGGGPIAVPNPEPEEGGDADTD
jgi:hypothetical protein